MINTSVVIISAVGEMMVVETKSDFMFEKKMYRLPEHIVHIYPIDI